MADYSTVQAAKKLGISMMTMHRYMRAKRFPVPRMQQIAGVRVRIWTEADITNARQLLPKIANGRKTRYKKQSAKTKRKKK